MEDNDNESRQCQCGGKQGDCAICNKCLCTGTIRRTVEGLKKLREYSGRKGDGLKAALTGKTSVQLHVKCHKDYTRRLPPIVNESENQGRLLRRDDEGFNLKECCLFCGDRLDGNHVSRKGVSVVATIEVKQQILDHALHRQDRLGLLVAARVNGVVADLVAAEVKYHTECFPAFFARPLETSEGAGDAPLRGRAFRHEKDAAFQKMCQFLESSDEPQHDMGTLMAKMAEFAAGGECYGVRHTRHLLKQKYGGAVIISNQTGKKGSVVTFLAAAQDILTGAWYKSKSESLEEETRRFIKKAAQLLRGECTSAIRKKDSYPNAEEIEGGGLSDVPPLLLLFLEELMKPVRCDPAPLTQRLAVAGDILSAIRPKSYLSPLHLGTGVLLHRRFGSRYVVDLMASLGKSTSYNEVMKYEGVMAVSAPPSVDRGAFIQFIFDNADHNTRTLTGHDTLHVAAGLMVVTPASKLQARAPVPRPKRAATTSEIGDRGVIDIEPYYAAKNAGLKHLVMDDVLARQGEVPQLENAGCLDFLWLAKHSLQESYHGWNGFMTAAHANEKRHDMSAFVPLPFIPLPATDPSTLYTALRYGRKKCDEYKQKTCVVTFDLPLFVKAMDIVNGCGDKLPFVVVRLGGFHLLMSFMGAVGALMAGSGLADLWKEVYAKNSADAMAGGHAYKRALRAHFLTQAALASLVIDKMVATGQISDVNIAKVRELYNKLDGTGGDLESMLSSPSVKEVRRSFRQALQEESENNRTAGLWLQYFDQVEIMTTFVRAERTGDWRLHLHCVGQMLPHLAAAGHLHYAKGAHLYLQEMQKLEAKMTAFEYEKFVESGWFSVFKSEKPYGGIWSDMIIEQVIMRNLKLQGGVTHGRGQSAATLSRFVNCAPHVVHITAALEEFCGVKKICSEQHEELGDSRQRRDARDLQTFIDYFREHPPFEQQPEALVSISNGLVADASVNCDAAVKIGLAVMQSSVVGLAFPDVHIRRKDKAVNIAATNATITVGEDRLQVNPSVLFHRIICNVHTEEMLEECMGHELAPRPTALFDDVSMRMGTKSKLIEVLSKLSPPTSDVPADPCYVIDGGFLLRRVQWPRPATYSTICDAYVAYVTKHYGHDCRVVFDGYGAGPSTKDVQHIRRASIAAKLTVTLDKTAAVTRDEFLGSSENKAQFLPLLSARLERAGVQVRHADADADYLIVQTALEAGRAGGSVVMVGEDTDLLVLLAVHANNTDVSMLMPGRQDSPRRVFCSKKLQEALGPHRDLLLLLHAFTGCDTTSAPYKRGKHMGFAKLEQLHRKKSPLLQTVSVFNNPSATREEIAAAGEEFFVALYGGKKGAGLNRTRYLSYKKMVARKKLTAKFVLESLPPTADAAHQHSYRVFLQVQAWRGVTLPATSWGWEEQHGRYMPVLTTLRPAPEYLLKLVYCNCKGACGGNCECRRVGLPCTSMCGICSGDGCTNSPTPIHDDDEEDDEEEVDQPLPVHCENDDSAVADTENEGKSN
ncbi:hypothetical protein FOCC_FOCC013607 [Frankliniella occidentalis]|nr:hypothetical protein FOCC_FOCC013607 [Frankliniella occidentalis]